MNPRVFPFLFALLLQGCGPGTQPASPPEPQITANSIIYPAADRDHLSLVSKPVLARPIPAVNLNGRITWDEDKTVRIYTPFAGRVARILVQPGDRVKQGQTLAVIASPDFGQAQAEARRADSDLAFAVKELEQHGVAARKDLQAAEADYARAEAEQQRTRTRLKLYGASSDSVNQNYALASPLAGVVVEKNINPGQELRPDQMLSNAPALFVITDPSTLWVQLDAAEKDLPQLKLGRGVIVRSPAYRDESFPATITAVSDFLDPATRTIKVRAVLDNEQRKLKGEMFVTAEAEGEDRMQLLVPAKAVFFQGGEHFVFTDEGAGQYVRREVHTGDAQQGSVVIREGLREGQNVVVDGTLMLQQELQPRRVQK
jgi:membrane fusion protein, heavy metal efflux system